MNHAFDPTAAIAHYLHPRVCDGHDTAISPIDCLSVQSAMPDWLAEMNQAGLAVVPLDAMVMLERLFDSFINGATPDEQAADPNSSAGRVLAATFVDIQYRDGSNKRQGPFPRWMAELVLGELNFNHSDDMHSAVLVAEPAWIAGLLNSLDFQAPSA